ncbi:amidohydrolase family protein [Prauserella oleivorans]
MVDKGLSPADALHAATLSAAELMGLDATLGSIEPGKRADLVVVDGDPLDVVGLGKRVRAVYQDGRAVHVRDD